MTKFHSLTSILSAFLVISSTKNADYFTLQMNTLIFNELKVNTLDELNLTYVWYNVQILYLDISLYLLTVSYIMFLTVNITGNFTEVL